MTKPPKPETPKPEAPKPGAVKPRFFDRDHPFFAKPWVRAVTVAVPGTMAVVDFTMGSPGWGVVFAGATAWALWELFLRR
ncbi:hypothetical protein [Tabrizicola oligotrophica]|uniref:DUF3329 domain-containing protein n=1 Tax=Tabrizicola oligotrophica TaxID=2710650 RepID=A0A6M0QUI4_9RHOB|nr:hypothetical protein [Tabrizicola oligotrophica]NEY90494.1 hypothetical protein [Tabrizicola oligotrophica]